MTTFNSKRILITGASSGIGRALALKLSADGHVVVALARSPERLAALRAEDARIETVVLDLSNTEAVLDFAAQPGIGEIDVLINNAGVQDQHRLDDVALTGRVMTGETATNLIAPMVLTKALLPGLTKAGLVVNLVSGLALAPKDVAATYSATKAGLKMFSAGIRAQFDREVLRVIDIYPPLVDTAMTAGRGGGKVSPEVAADAIIAAMNGHKNSVAFGPMKVMAVIARLAPGLATRMMSK